MSFISVDPLTELLLILGCIFSAIIAAFLFLLFFRSRKQLGAAFARAIKTLVLMPSGVYESFNMKASSDTIETKALDHIALARSKTIYKPMKSGPNLAIIDPISDSTLNARLLNYVLQMKEGKNKERIKFDSKEEAFFNYYENKFLPNYKDAHADWIDEQKERVKAAKQIIARKTKKTTTDFTDKGTIGKETAEFTFLKPMSKIEYDNLVIAISNRLVEETEPIFPIEIDHETITLNDIAKWESKPESVVVTKSQFERGRELERKRQRGDAVKILVLGLVFSMVAIAASIGYRIFAK